MGRGLKLQASELKIQLEMLNSLLDVVTVEIRWKKFVFEFSSFFLTCVSSCLGMFLNDIIDGSTSKPRPV